MPTIDDNDPRPPYQQIAADLRRIIKAGDLRPGQRMKSNRELATEYGVAAMTVYQAMRVLREEGLVISHQGRGVFVSSGDTATEGPFASDPAAQIDALDETVQRLDERVGSVEGELREDIKDLRRQVGEFRAQLIELYARTGHQYPRDQSTKVDSPARRKASGS